MTHHVHEFAAILDLDADVLGDYWDEAMAWLRDRLGDGPTRLIVDVGAGSGVATLALAQLFAEAEVVAVDQSAELLEHLAGRVAERGLASRVRTVAHDLDAGWPEALHDLDLTWASMSLHHLADPGLTLGSIRTATRPGGHIAVAELTEPLRFLRDGEFAAVEAALVEASTRVRRHELPTLHTPWAPRLAAAGWEVVDEHDFVIDVPAPEHPRAVDYARAWFARVPDEAIAQLDATDRALVQGLRAPGGLDRGDLHLRSVRTVTLGRRA